jgi:hypothetical protein
LAPPPGLTDLQGLSGHQFVHEGPLPGPWPEQPTDPLHVLALAQGASDDHGDVRIRHVQALIEYA